MPVNPKTLIEIITEEITRRVMEGTMCMKEIDNAHSYLDRNRLMNAIADASREQFWNKNYRRFRAELIMRTAEVFDVTEDMVMGWDGDREYVQDIYVKEKFSDDEHPRRIKQFADTQWEDEEWNDFMEFIRKERKKEIMEEYNLDNDYYF